MSADQQARPGGLGTIAGRTVARIGFGAMQLERSSRPEDELLTVLRSAIAAGITHIDTAEFYGDGRCNRLIRQALAPYSDDIVIVSKVGAVNGPDGGLIPAQRPAELRDQIEQNLATLGIDQLAVVNLRRADAPPGIVAEGEQMVDLDDQLAELISLRDAGKIGGIGLSAVTADQLARALPADIACVQNLYNLLDRTGEPVLELCRANDIAWVPFFPLGSGFAGWERVTDRPEVIALADELAVTPAQVGLAWLLAAYENTLLIPGTSDPRHLAENVAAGAVELSPAQFELLDAIRS